MSSCDGLRDGERCPPLARALQRSSFSASPLKRDCRGDAECRSSSRAPRSSAMGVASACARFVLLEVQTHQRAARRGDLGLVRPSRRHLQHAALPTCVQPCAETLRLRRLPRPLHLCRQPRAFRISSSRELLVQPRLRPPLVVQRTLLAYLLTYLCAFRRRLRRRMGTGKARLPGGGGPLGRRPEQALT